MNTLKYLLILITAITITSCKKYLDEKSNSSLVTPSTLADFQAMFDDAILMNQQSTPCFGEASADDYFITDEYYGYLIEREQYVYSWRPYDYTFQNDWSMSYFPVYNANVSLEGLARIPQTPSNQVAWNNVAGSAYFFRAYSYLGLLWVHAKTFDEAAADSDPGIVLREGSDFNVPSTRASVRKCYEQVINDARLSVALLPDLPLHPFRPSKAAAFGLLARAFLSMRQYDSAGIYADKCLSLQGNLMNYNELDMNGYPFSRFNKETIFYTEMNQTISSPVSWIALMDTTLYDSYEDNDLRKPGFYGDAGNGYQVFKGNYTRNPYIMFTGIATDEMFLISAESMARAENTSAAMDRLNQLLETRYSTGTYITRAAASPGEALAMILQERRKELTMRGLRWMDIKRLNKEGANIVLTRHVNGETYTLLPNDNYYALPLPKDIIDATGIPQNSK